MPDAVIAELDVPASQLNLSRAEVIRQAIEYYLEDFDDLSVIVERYRDSSDPVLGWDQVRREVLDTD